jgi:hypothetical protein
MQQLFEKAGIIGEFPGGPIFISYTALCSSKIAFNKVEKTNRCLCLPG